VENRIHVFIAPHLAYLFAMTNIVSDPSKCLFTNFNEWVCEAKEYPERDFCNVCEGVRPHDLGRLVNLRFSTEDGTLSERGIYLRSLINDLRWRNEERIRIWNTRLDDAHRREIKYVCPTESYYHRNDTHIIRIRTKVSEMCVYVDKKDSFCKVCADKAFELFLCASSGTSKQELKHELKPTIYLCALKDKNFAGRMFQTKVTPSSGCNGARNRAQMCEACWVEHLKDALGYVWKWFYSDTRMLNSEGLTKMESKAGKSNRKVRLLAAGAQRMFGNVKPIFPWHERSTGKGI
jgi:hypothetical protein